MDYTVISIVAVAMIALVYYTLRMIGKPKDHDHEREEYIRKEVEAIDGSLISIEKIKKKDFIYAERLGLKDDGVYVPYKVMYKQYDEEIEGWAILLIKGALISSSITQKDGWIIKL